MVDGTAELFRSDKHSCSQSRDLHSSPFCIKTRKCCLKRSSGHCTTSSPEPPPFADLHPSGQGDCIWGHLPRRPCTQEMPPSTRKPFAGFLRPLSGARQRGWSCHICFSSFPLPGSQAPIPKAAELRLQTQGGLLPPNTPHHKHFPPKRTRNFF